MSHYICGEGADHREQGGHMIHVLGLQWSPPPHNASAAGSARELVRGRGTDVITWAELAALGVTICCQHMFMIPHKI